MNSLIVGTSLLLAVQIGTQDSAPAISRIVEHEGRSPGSPWEAGPAPALSRPRIAVQSGGVEELLRLHHEQRVAHVLGDAMHLTASFTDSMLEVVQGRILTLARGEARARFVSYLNAVHFLEWEDERPPKVRISPDGRWAEVAVEKRVRTVPSDTTRSKNEGAAVFAWVSRWVRTESSWQLATITSTQRPVEDEPAREIAERIRAYDVLRRARQALGGDAAVAQIATLRFTAESEGPRGRYITEVASARDGRVAFSQRSRETPPFAAGVSLDGPWRLTPDGVDSDALGTALETMISAHELHLLAIAPEARYRSPRARPGEQVRGREVDVVRFSDRLGAPVDFLYDTVTGRPAGIRLINHWGRGEREIVHGFADWRRVGDVELPFEITVTQGDDVYRFHVVDASAEWLTDAAFRAPATAESER